MTVTTLTLFRFDEAKAKAWAFTQMLWARRPLAALPGIGFHKLFGSGTREGFHPWPNFGVYGVFAVWPDLPSAQEQVSDGIVYRRYRERSVEEWTVYMQISQCRGQWDGEVPFKEPEVPVDSQNDCVAVLTRATVKARYAPEFWRQVPDISGAVREQDHLLVKIGLGEVPWLHQVTFTIWDDAEAMNRFAYEGFHGDAIKKVRDGGWFKEELFARFDVLGAEGNWNGICPFGLEVFQPSQGGMLAAE